MLLGAAALRTVFLGAVCAVPAGAQDAGSLEPLPPDEVSRRLAAIAEAHPDLAAHRVVGTSRGERPIEVLRLRGAPEGQAVPGLLVVANVSGPRAFETRLALWQAEELARRWSDGDGAARALLAGATLYFVPAPHPDVLARRFEAPAGESTASGRGVDDDRDGRQGEDPPADVDGDGVVAWMRVPDPAGTWRAADDEPRVTVEADAAAGEQGVWKLVREGRDRDGDGDATEDAPHDTLLDRHFPAGWEEHLPHAGLFPLDEPEARALAELVLERRDLALVLVYGDRDNLAQPPDGVEAAPPRGRRIPPTGIVEGDAEVLEEIGERYRERTGVEERSSEPGAGSFQRWVYEHRGLLCLAAVLWEMPTEAPAPEGRDGEAEDEDGAEDKDGNEDGGARDSGEAGSDDPAQEKEQEKQKEKDSGDAPPDEIGRLAWTDAVDPSRFLPWTPFEHPELGPVEIGGWRPHARRDPPAAARAEIAEDQLAFLLSLGELLPRVAVAELTARDLGGGLWRVEAAVENRGLLPVLTAAARRSRTTRPARVALELGDGAVLVSGRPQELAHDLAGGGGRAEYTWLVRTDDPSAIELVVDTDPAGDARARAEVVQ